MSILTVLSMRQFVCYEASVQNSDYEKFYISITLFTILTFLWLGLWDFLAFGLFILGVNLHSISSLNGVLDLLDLSNLIRLIDLCWSNFCRELDLELLFLLFIFLMPLGLFPLTWSSFLNVVVSLFELVIALVVARGWSKVVMWVSVEERIFGAVQTTT